MIGNKERHFVPFIHIADEEVVPANHFYRQMDGSIDLSYGWHPDCCVQIATSGDRVCMANGSMFGQVVVALNKITYASHGKPFVNSCSAAS